MTARKATSLAATENNLPMPLLSGQLIRFRNQLLPYWQTVQRSGLVHLLSANLFSQALGFISSLLVVRFLTPAELGEARVIGTYSGYVQILGSLGLASAVLTFIPRSGDPGVRKYWLLITLVISAVATTFISLVTGWMSWQGWLMSSESTSYWYRWSLLGVLATSATSLLISFYQAERALRELAGLQSVMRAASLLVTVGGAWLGGFEGYIIAGIGTAFMTLGSFAFMRRRDHTPVRREPLPTGYLKVAGLALLGVLLWTAGRTADVVILDRLTTERARFGCYSFALALAMIMSLINGSVQTVTVPFFSTRHQAADWVLAKARKWQAAGALLSLFGTFAAITLAALLIRPFYGPAYTETVSFLVPLLLAQCVLATFHIQAAALIGLGLVRVNTIIAAIVVPISVLVTYEMARKYGITGAAWGQVVSAGIYAVMQSFWGWTVLSRRSKAQAETAVVATALAQQ